MTTIQKTIITATIAVLAGAGIYEARQASQLRDQVQTLQQQQAPLAGQIEQMQTLLGRMTNGLNAAAEQSSNNEKDNSELLKLRGEIGVLRRQAEELKSAKAQFAKLEGKLFQNAKEISVALRMFAADNNDAFPTNYDQIKAFVGGVEGLVKLDANAFEIVIAGSNNLVEEISSRNHLSVNRSNTVAIRERVARQAPDGTWSRIYVFVDGRTEAVTSYDGNFADWEKANTFTQSPNMNQ